MCGILCVCALAGIAIAPTPAHPAEGCPPLAGSFASAAVVTGQAWQECPDPAAAATSAVVPTALAGVAAPPLAMISTGNAADASLPNDVSDTTTQFDTYVRGAWDVSIVRVDLAVPEGTNCLLFDFVFASEEQVEFRGSQFNDGFLAELDGSSWSVSGGAIDAPDNFALDREGAMVSINSATFNPSSDTGTEYDGATDHLVAQAPAVPGAHSLYLSLFDASDAQYDSAVWLANLRAESRDDGVCPAGVNEAPEAVVSATPAAGGEPLGVSFSGVDSTDDGQIVAYDWDFGDAQAGSGPAAEHTYVTGGTYTAVLKVTDDAGLTASASTTVSVTGGNQAPEARFSALPDFGDPPLSVTFDASGSTDADGEIVELVWDFGDGTGGTGSLVTHDYPLAGSYEVRLAAIDDAGGVGYGSHTIIVGSGPPVSDHVTLRILERVHWATIWTVDADLSSGDLDVDVADGQVRSVTGTAGVAGTTGGQATITFAIRKLGPFPWYFGAVRVQDPAAGIDVAAPFVPSITSPEAGVAVGANVGIRWLPKGGALFEGVKVVWRVVDAG